MDLAASEEQFLRWGGGKSRQGATKIFFKCYLSITVYLQCYFVLVSGVQHSD